MSRSRSHLLFAFLAIALAAIAAATASTAAMAGGPKSSTVYYPQCDIVVLGGSTASLAAALAASDASPTNVTVCFVELTDMPGGQLTSSGVSAIDYSHQSHYEVNNGRLFASLMQWTRDDFPGKNSTCWVSFHCATAQSIYESWIQPQIRAREKKNLRVFLRGAVVSTVREKGKEFLASVTVVQRFPASAESEWDAPLSETLPDWYSPTTSDRFLKRLVTFASSSSSSGNPPIFIEATEFGDVLALTDGVRFTQGYEFPHETSRTSNPSCGLSTTMVFFTNILPDDIEAATENRTKRMVPAGRGSDAGQPFPPVSSWADAQQWNLSWTYRRGVLGNGPQSTRRVNVGDVSQQNWLNDLNTAYIFDGSINNRGSSKRSAGWVGGINITALKMAEARSEAFFWFLDAACKAGGKKMQNCSRQFSIDSYSSGTMSKQNAMCKLPYLRDSRRAFGISSNSSSSSSSSNIDSSFRLLYADENYYNSSNPFSGRYFHDTVALSSYIYSDMHRLTFCELPAYAAHNETRPYHVPFRALTVNGVSNLLVAGKTMAQSFHANAASRLHPDEWSTGTAAGAAAALMVAARQNQTKRATFLTTSQVYESHIDELRALISDNAGPIAQPLFWTIRNKPSLVLGYACVAGSRCMPVDDRIPAANRSSSTTCQQQAACSPLAANEWFASAKDWKPCASGDVGEEVCGGYHLVKAVADWIVVPKTEELSTSAITTRCKVFATISGVGYLVTFNS